MKAKSKKKVTIAAHDDADGVSAAVLLSEYLGGAEVRFPKEFGVVDDGDDYVVDMRPMRGDWRGICWDHHNGHPPEGARNYELHWANVPTSVIVWKELKNFIPKESWWKCVIGAAGDNQSETVPPEVWRSCPELFTEIERPIRRFGVFKGYRTFRFLLMPAVVNAPCRLGNPEKAYSVLKSVKSPSELVGDPALNEDRIKVEREIDWVVEGFGSGLQPQPRLVGPFLLAEFEHECPRLSGRLASILSELAQGLTVIAIHRATGKMSIRGPLTQLVRESLNEGGIAEVDGHTGAVGGLCDMSRVNEIEGVLRRSLGGK
jgi:hypothetical protein